MRGDFTVVDYEVLEHLWNQCAPSRYSLSGERLRSHIEQDQTADLSASTWLTYADHLVAFAAIKRSANPSLYAGPDPSQAHLSLLGFKEFSFANQVLDLVEEKLRHSGVTKLIFGQDARHFFPGVPEDWPGLREFFAQRGYEESGKCFDLEADVGSLTPMVNLGALVARPCAAEDLTALTEFFEQEFPHRWKHDVLLKWNLEGPETVFGLFSDGRCVGFALLQHGGCQLPIGGAVWERSLGENWGALGPIGISKEMRGHGVGKAFLSAALERLKLAGARRTIIDWTTLEDYYGNAGFSVSRRYICIAKQL